MAKRKTNKEVEVVSRNEEDEYVDEAEVAMDNDIAETTGENFQEEESEGEFEALNMTEDDDEQDDEETEAEPFDVDNNGQTTIPGTEEESEPEQRARPRGREEVERDFRMAVFGGQVKKVTEDWKSGRKLSVMIESDDRARLTKGLEKFTASDDLVFRVLPMQPRFNDKEPEEFGTKVPRFGVAMIERLEQKAFEGFMGWQDMEPIEILKRMVPIVSDVELTIFDMDPGRVVEQEQLQKQLVDIANYAFFMWWNSKKISEKNKARL